MVEIILFFIFLVSGIVAIQITRESTLALKVKHSLYLLQPYDKRLALLAKVDTWWHLFPRLFLVILPLIIVSVIVLRCHHFLSELLSCEKCTSVWIAFLLLHFYIEKPLIESIIFAPLAILAVIIINRLECHE